MTRLIHRSSAARLLPRALCVASVLITFACASGSNSNSNCTCASDEKFNGDKCVASGDFEAPTDCTDDGTAVCGCDGEGYTSECEAYASGVQVANQGKCGASGSTGDTGGGW